MTRPLQRLHDWWSPTPVIDEDRLAEPERDDELAFRMAAEAQEFARSDPALDFSPSSLRVLDGWVDEKRKVAIRPAGAYVGEVLVRNGQRVYWARSGRGRRNAGVAVEKWLADPFDRLSAQISGAWKGSDELCDYVTWVLAYEGDRGFATEQAGGLSARFQSATALKAFGEWARRRRERHP